MESENKYIETDLGNVAPNPRGEYDPAVAYEYLDLVEYSGGSYLCIQESGTVTGVAPAQNKNTEVWQVLTIPGDLTPEYIAMHDDVVNKAESAQADAASTAADREQVESMLANVEQLHTQTDTAAQEASDSRDSAAGYATAAEASRTAAAESEKNAQLQVTGFDETVNAAKQEATEEIATARKTAVQAVAAQQVKSVNAVNEAGSAAIEKTSADAKEAKDAAAAAVSAANAAEGGAREATAAAEQAKNNKQSAETAAATAKNSAAAAETAKKAVEGAAEQIETNTAGIEALKEDLGDLNDKKITKFYASSQGETHITDSGNGKMQDMMIYGKSSQDGTPTPESPVEIKSVVNPTVKIAGKNLLNPTLQTTTKNGVTCINNGDGTYTLNGTATSNTQLVVGYHNILDGQVKMLGCPSGGSTKTYCVIMQFSSNITGGEKGRIYDIGNGGVGSKSNSIESGANYIRCIISIISGTTCNNLLFKPMLTTDLTATYDDFEPYHEQTITLPYTLNAIPVSSGGNVTIDGQQYIADYVDVERGKVIRNILKWHLADIKSGFNNTIWHINISKLGVDGSKIGLSNMFKIQNNSYSNPTISELYISADGKIATLNMRGMTDEEFKKWIIEKNPAVYSVLTVAEEVLITLEEVSAFKQLMTYYPITNISANSDQLDGYTVFNYPISMANGWNYVKQQLNDNRDYIYDMDLQSAESYVNSEYAVALTELEV